MCVFFLWSVVCVCVNIGRCGVCVVLGRRGVCVVLGRRGGGVCVFLRELGGVCVVLGGRGACVCLGEQHTPRPPRTTYTHHATQEQHTHTPRSPRTHTHTTSPRHTTPPNINTHTHHAPQEKHTPPPPPPRPQTSTHTPRLPRTTHTPPLPKTSTHTAPPPKINTHTDTPKMLIFLIVVATTFEKTRSVRSCFFSQIERDLKKHIEWQNSKFCRFWRFCHFCHFCRFCCAQTQTPVATATHKTDNTVGILLSKRIVLYFWEGQRDHKVLPGGHDRAREDQFCGHRGLLRTFWEGQREPPIVAGSGIVTPSSPSPPPRPPPLSIHEGWTTCFLVCGASSRVSVVDQVICLCGTGG